MKDKFSIKALLVAILYAVITSMALIGLFFGGELKTNLLLGGFVILAIIAVVCFESSVIYAFHKAYLAHRKQKSNI